MKVNTCLLSWCLFFHVTIISHVVFAKTVVRYRNGALEDVDTLQELTLSVAKAREHCRETPSCVTFSFQSETRFPSGPVKCYFYSVADWHVTEGEPSFVEYSEWHTYVNSTRERDALPTEIRLILDRLGGGGTSGNNLRGGASKEEKLTLLTSLYYMINPRQEHRIIAAPLLTAKLIKLATTDEPEIQEATLRLLIVLGDSTETGNILFDAGIYEAMKKIIDRRGEEWDEISEYALDVISNICIHRSANAKLRRAGALGFLQDIVSEPGFAGIQSLIALTHIIGDEADIIPLPSDKVTALVELLRNAIDGDIAYDILWDILPGPLSAIKYLVKHTNKSTLNSLLDAGLMEELIDIIESECMDPSEVEAGLHVILDLARASKRARHMAMLFEEAIHEAQEKLRNYSRVSDLATSLATELKSYEETEMEL